MTITVTTTNPTPPTAMLSKLSISSSTLSTDPGTPNISATMSTTPASTNVHATGATVHARTRNRRRRRLTCTDARPEV
ncbi:hypothetical protein ABZW11_33500 [Nonomuraea sp. NPDC004580]|uniref:hypothetical protein n=1 Tax=Nonomuraea sp. NPDC004580 TaxID=3154552 RepID=UPI0033AE0A64